MFVVPGLGGIVVMKAWDLKVLLRKAGHVQKRKKMYECTISVLTDKA